MPVGDPPDPTGLTCVGPEARGRGGRVQGKEQPPLNSRRAQGPAPTAQKCRKTSSNSLTPPRAACAIVSVLSPAAGGCSGLCAWWFEAQGGCAVLCCSRVSCRCLLQLFLQCCGCACCSPSVPHIPVSRGGLLCAHRQGLAFPVRARPGNERRPGWPPPCPWCQQHSAPHTARVLQHCPHGNKNS